MLALIIDRYERGGGRRMIHLLAAARKWGDTGGEEGAITGQRALHTAHTQHTSWACTGMHGYAMHTYLRYVRREGEGGGK